MNDRRDVSITSRIAWPVVVTLLPQSWEQLVEVSGPSQIPSPQYFAGAGVGVDVDAGAGPVPQSWEHVVEVSGPSHSPFPQYGPG